MEPSTSAAAAPRAPAPAAIVTDHHDEHHAGGGFWGLLIGSVGVVYGDIGTSPLYAFRESVKAAAGGATPDANVLLGILSLMIWTLIVIVTLKYVLLLLRADNNGEGGTLALMALAQKALGNPSTTVLALGMIGAALFYGDAILTPAISVLSAVEGLKLATTATHAVEELIVPISLVILIGLFAVQSRGTETVARFFGPVMVIWFIVIAALGVAAILRAPGVFAAVDPVHGVNFILHAPKVGFAVLGAVFLTVTGAEALYADLGHFGKKPIRAAWIFFVFPALLLNYFGQAALVMVEPAAIDNPFFRLAPEWGRLALVLLSTIATIIASQAVITGAFSLTRQAIQLGLMPRMEIRHTSAATSGQIFIPRVNMLIALGVVTLVLAFRSSDALTSAYGIAVTGTMVVTAIMAFIVMWRAWGWSPVLAAIVVAPLLLIDLIFLAANSLKIHEGGYIPLLIGAVLLVIMATWRRGSRILFEKTRKSETPLEPLARSLEKRPPPRVAGAAIFLTGDRDFAPTALLHSLKHYKVLHERNIILTVKIAPTPRVREEERMDVEPLNDLFTRITLRFGFFETPHVPRALSRYRTPTGQRLDIMSTSYFLSRRTLKVSARPIMPLWQDRLFILLTRNASGAAEFFHIPTDRAVELGTQISV